MSEEVTEGGEGVAPVEGQPPVSDPPPAMPAEGAAPERRPEEAMAEAPAPAPSAPPPGEPEVSAPIVSSTAPAPAAEGGGKKKRRKIDLKSRLSSVRASGSMAKAGPSERKSDPLSFPPPPTSSVPAPKIGPISSPLISSAFAPPEPEKKPTAQQQTIKVEMGEEIVQERKKASKRTALLVALGALIAGVLGFFVGGAQVRGERGKKAIESAGELATDVDAANQEMAKLADAIRKAVEALGQDEYPNDLVEVLKTTNVPFGAENFQGKSIGGLPAETFNMLLRYTNGVGQLNEQKDKVRKLLGVAEKPVKEYISEKEKPVIKFGILFSKKKETHYAEIFPVKKPFEAKGEWPESFTLVQGKGKKAKDVEVQLWDGKAKLSGGDKKQAMPVSRETTAQFTDLSVIFKLRGAMMELKELIDGNNSPIPQQQTDGLYKDGENLIEALKKVSNAG